MLYGTPLLGKGHEAPQNDWLRRCWLEALLQLATLGWAEPAGGGGERMPQLHAADPRALAMLACSEAYGRLEV